MISGEAEILPFKKTASEAFAFNDVVTKGSTGYITKATASTPRSEVLGLIQRTVASTDSDYASNTVVEVQMLDEDAIFEGDVGTGSAVQAMVGKKFDLKDENELNVNSQIVKLFEITSILSTTKVRGRFRVSDSEKARYVTYQQTVSVADFTDGGAAAGTLDLTTSIPAGAVFVQSIITDIVGFAGDTTAVLAIGDGTTATRYMTGTPSVFATAAAGVDLGVPSGTKWHTAATTPRLTVTGTADFTSIVTNGLGSAIVTLIWITTR